MGLLWTFMGFSTAYQMFTGSVEVVAGLLLATRRTTPLGAMFTIIAMTQVVALNLCFDVPVKLYSMHYLAMGWFLLAPDVPRVLKVLVLHRAVEAVPLPPPPGRWWLGRIALGVRLLVVGMLLWVNVYFTWDRWAKSYGGPPVPVQGRWEVEAFRLDGQDLGPDDPRRWRSLDFSLKALARVHGPKPPALTYRVKWDADAKRMTLTKFADPKWSAEFTYALPESDRLTLSGSLESKAVETRLKRLPVREYELTKRGFHWVQELPYNR
jgi:hypothetical protein